MHLKRLDLYGFKTFPDRTHLDFGSGVTAVVGPNGSGKSNLVDAVLWALGEQSMKHLRSARSHDVIFSGSDNRKPLGVAEASLTFDNSAGGLPLEFSEVTVTRRVFRSGDGEYEINRVPCRLRDIHELFLDTGIGKEAYSIITQNEIDAVLSIRGEDRRMLFEEAAGIQKYRVRKKEAMRRLDNTRQNMLRVTDIMAELEAQLIPLAQQSEEARHYRELSEELGRLKLGLLIEQYQQGSAGLDRARERERTLSDQIEAHRAQITVMSAQEVTLRAALQAAEGRLEELRGLVARTTAAVDKAETASAVAQERLKALRRQAETWEQERAETEQRLRDLEREIATTSAEHQRIAGEVAEQKSRIDSQEAAVRAAEATLAEAARGVEDTRAAYLETIEQLTQARNEALECQSLLRAQEGRRARLEVELGELREALAATEEHRHEAERELAGLADALARHDGDISRLADDLRAARSRVDDISGERARLAERLAADRARHQALADMDRAREGVAPGARALLTAAESGEVSGRFHLVGDILRTSTEHERAVEAALGSALDWIVTDDLDTACAALDWVRAREVGRVGLLPMSKASRRSLPAAPSGEGVVGRAADLVTAPPEFARIIAHLLGDVIVVRDLEAALALVESSPDARVVTLDGESICPAGVLIGGRGGQTVMGRKRELSELAEATAAGERALADADQRLAAAQAQVASLAERAEVARAERVELAAAMAEREREVAAAGEESSRLRERAEAIEGEYAEAAVEVAEARREHADLSARVASLEQAEREANQAMGDADEAVRVAQAGKDGAGAELARQRLVLAALAGRLEALDSARDRAEANRCDLAQQLDSRQARRAALDEQAAELEREIAEVERHMAEAVSARTHAESDLDSARDERQRILDQIAANLEQVKAERQQTEADQASLHRSQVRAAQLEAEAGFAERTLMDDHRLTVEQALRTKPEIGPRAAAQARLADLQTAIEGLGTVNLGAVEQHQHVMERLGFLRQQREDLEQARADIQRVIAEIEQVTHERFLATLEEVGREFQDLFARLFDGGSTEIFLSNPEDVMESGVEIEVTVPGKRRQNLLLLSGGERALTAVAILFALLRVKPSPFVILDEIDAPLDEANTERFCELLRDFSSQSQFVVITHNKGTMEAADVLYGVTMEEAGVSTLISVRLSDQVAAAA